MNQLERIGLLCMLMIIMFDSFDSFEAEHIPKEITKLIGNKNIIMNINKIQAYDLVMCVYFCIQFIDFMLKGKSSLEFINLFSPNDYEKNEKTIL